MSDNLLNRALAAYHRSGAKLDGAIMQPAMDRSGVVDHDGKRYVLLANVRGALAVYRVQNRGTLKGLKRWPDAIGKHVGG